MSNKEITQDPDAEEKLLYHFHSISISISISGQGSRCRPVDLGGKVGPSAIP